MQNQFLFDAQVKTALIRREVFFSENFEVLGENCQDLDAPESKFVLVLTQRKCALLLKVSSPVTGCCIFLTLKSRIH